MCIRDSAYPVEYKPFDQRNRMRPKDWPCPACRSNLRKADPAHSRHPENCRFPLVQEVPLTCP
eukprot:4310392-Prorocentrum_lima.AAC.1